MKKCADFLNLNPRPQLKFLLTDIDDTITTDGQLSAEAYASLYKLNQCGFLVIPVTGRPAGWCEMIARFWPVAGVVGENGGFYFRYDQKNKKMLRWFSQSHETRHANAIKLKSIESEVLQKITGCKVSSDQFSRLTDLAIDFNEDVEKLPDQDVQQIVKIFEEHGATAKVSSIHVNGWFGTHTKLSTSLEFLKSVYNISSDETKKICAYTGDSPNDEPMFEFFPYSFGVANIVDFQNHFKFLPSYIASQKNGEGFSEIVNILAHQH